MAIDSHLALKDHLRERRLVNARLIFAAIFFVFVICRCHHPAGGIAGC